MKKTKDTKHWETLLNSIGLEMSRGEVDENGRRYKVFSEFEDGLSTITGESVYGLSKES